MFIMYIKYKVYFKIKIFNNNYFMTRIFGRKYFLKHSKNRSLKHQSTILAVIRNSMEKFHNYMIGICRITIKVFQELTAVL